MSLQCWRGRLRWEGADLNAGSNIVTADGDDDHDHGDGDEDDVDVSPFALGGG